MDLWLSIGTAIATSLLASVIFYIIFDLKPTKKKYRKIRPRIEVELMEITESLFFFIEISLKHNKHFASFFQQEITDGSLEDSDFELCLYNKCLSEDYLFDENANALIVVGPELQKKADQLSSQIQQVLISQAFLTPEEILIIEDIHRLLHVYSYDMKAVDDLGGIKTRVVNPTISYMHGTFKKLLTLRNELRGELYRCKLIHEEKRQGNTRYFTLQTEFARQLINNQDYSKASAILRKLYRDNLTVFQKCVIRLIQLRIAIETNDTDHAKETLVQILKDNSRESLVTLRGYLQCVHTNTELMELCTALCSQQEITKWEDAVKQESLAKERFLNQNRKLKSYYEKLGMHGCLS